MRAELEALAHELKEWRREGVTAVPIAEETLVQLRAAVAAIVAAHPPAAPASAARAPAAPASAQVEETPAPAPRAKRSPAPEAARVVASIPTPPRVELPAGDPQTRWNWLRDRVLGDLICQEHVRPGKQVVFGVGAVEAEIFFCGEAPGAEEEVQGEPFVGPAGQLLTRIIGAMGFAREDVYIGNIMNWRPELETNVGNRPPTPEEMAYCLPFLRAQLEVVQPKVIVALGKTAVDGLLGPDPKRRMGKIRGQWTEFEGIPLIPTFHPSYLLRNQAKSTKRLVWEDMLAVLERLGKPISAKQQTFFQ